MKTQFKESTLPYRFEANASEELKGFVKGYNEGSTLIRFNKVDFGHPCKKVEMLLINEAIAENLTEGGLLDLFELERYLKRHSVGLRSKLVLNFFCSRINIYAKGLQKPHRATIEQQD